LSVKWYNRPEDSINRLGASYNELEVHCKGTANSVNKKYLLTASYYTVIKTLELLQVAGILFLLLLRRA